jgi:hypothetical protein
MKIIQLLLFLFLPTIFSFGQSSLDSLRLVLPEGHDAKSFITNIHQIKNSNHFISVGSDGTSFLFDVFSQKRLVKYDLDKYASISERGDMYISIYKDTSANIYTLNNDLIYSFKKSNCILSGFYNNDNFAIAVSQNGEIFKLNLKDLDIEKIHLSKKISYATWNTSKTHIITFDEDNMIRVINILDFRVEQELLIKEKYNCYFSLADFNNYTNELIIFMNNEIIINPNNVNERKYLITGDAPLTRICNNFFQDIFFTDDARGLYHLSVTNDTLMKIYEHKSLITALINSNDKSLLAGSFDGDIFQINTNTYSMKKFEYFVPMDRKIQINEFDLFSNAPNILTNEIFKFSINQNPPKKLFSKNFFQDKKKIYLLSDSIHAEFKDEKDLDRKNFIKLKSKKEIWSVFQLSKSEFFVSSFSDFQYYDFNNNVFEELKTDGIIESLLYRSRLGHVLILTWGDGLLLYNTHSQQLNELCNEANCFSISQNFEEIVVGGTNGYLYFLDNKKYSVRDSIQLKGSTQYGAHLRNKEINSITFLNERILLIDLKNDEYLILDIESRLSLKIFKLVNNNWLIKLPNSPYYMCSKDASKMLHYVTPSLKVIGFEQLDPVYNRPDIVLDSIGKYFGGADAELVANYRQSWEKRIDRLGLDKEKLGKGDIAVPDAEIVDADKIAYENKDGKLSLMVNATDPKYTLRRFNIYVNEVPLYGSAGISIAQLKKQHWDTTLSVPLSLGENKIQVSVMNELGLENFKYPTYVNYTPVNNTIVAKTHYIGIGVNHFKDQNHDLKFCVDDVTDLAQAFNGKNTVTKLFTDQKVTRENILKLKQYLQDSTTVNDKVIISCSSHGLLDDSLNFYLATHDVNFENPKARGLKYEELEGLLDGIPARQKLLLLDACNSGENDKTEVLKKELEEKMTRMDSTQVLAARGAIIRLEQENKSNFKKMNELFVNVRNNTGSVIISAAGGRQSALEGDAVEVNGEKIENGAFTYSVLEYLKTNAGNQEALTVNKLKNYVENRVEEITNGKQKPTSRQETMEVDWRVR